MDKLAVIIPLLPFVSFLLGSWVGRKNWKAAAWIAVVLNAAAAVIAIPIAVQWLQNPAAAASIPWQVQWLSFGNGVNVSAGVLLDPISIMMLVVVTVISTLVNIYSIGYMKDDPAAGRFFPVLSLFSFSMLGLVIAPNVIQTYFFWELVGVSSYLLIGFWYFKPSAVAASKKAFIVTRFADSFFLLGILLVIYLIGNVDYSVLNSKFAIDQLLEVRTLGNWSAPLLALATTLIFAGGWGKSAMFPLHVWLPDAMEGPTPVSSIIHSATMVVAGVYLVARLFPLFVMSEFTMHVILYIGAFTAIFAAVIAITQKDIKRILAFSTLSQIGYMLFALGTGRTEGGEVNILGYSSSMYHVFTHAFFKCLLFLSAGQIIHAVHTNSIKEMGGLAKKLPVTAIATGLACLAIAGVPPFSGFFSKDEIVLSAYLAGHKEVFVIGLITGFLTAFYMFRLYFTVFFNKPAHEHHHAHENKYMNFSILVLVIPTVFIGWLSKDIFLNNFVPVLTEPLPPEAEHHVGWLPYLATASAFAAILLSYFIYFKNWDRAEKLSKMFGPVYRVIENKFYIDEVYLFVTRRIIFRFIAEPFKWFDRNVVDGLMNLTGFLIRVGGLGVRVLQTGYVQFYLAVTLLGLYLIFHFGTRL